MQSNETKLPLYETHPLLNVPIRITRESVAPNTTKYAHNHKAIPNFVRLYFVTESLHPKDRDSDLIVTISRAPKQKQNSK